MSESDVNPLLRKALENSYRQKTNKKIVPQGRKLRGRTRRKLRRNSNSIAEMAKRMADETPQQPSSCLSGMCTISGGGTGASTMKIPEIEITQDNLDLLEVGDLIRFYYGAGFNTRHGVIEFISDNKVHLRNVSHEWNPSMGEESKMVRAKKESIPKDRIGNMIRVFKYDTPSGIAEEVHNNLRPSTPENPEEADNLPPSTPENPEEGQTTGGKRKRKKRKTRKKKKRKTKRKKRKTKRKKRKRKTKTRRKKRGGMDGEKQPKDLHNLSRTGDGRLMAMN